MNKKRKVTLFLLMIASMLNACGKVNSKVQVVDEAGDPIEGAEVRFSYVNYKNEEEKVLITDAEGFVRSSGTAELRVNLSVSKEGYYKTRYDKSEGTALGKNQNHNIEVRLRKIENPIPLHVKKAIVGVPRENEWFGYDLEIGDLVSPSGNGQRVDFLLKVDAVGTMPNGSVKPKSGTGKFWIKFPNAHEGLAYEKDGFSGLSQMRMPHKAPKEGYVASLEREEKSYHNEFVQRGVGIFLRVRVKENEEAEIEEAHYAKITSDIYFDPRETGWHQGDAGKPKVYGGVRFTYYFNPTPNDRNLEFDPEKNLFKNLPRNEQVREP